jgi:hypothetical protein
MTGTKYSGTLVHTSAYRDLCSLTICAIAHFVYGFSDGKLVFADLQGMSLLLYDSDSWSDNCSSQGGGDGLVLFDLMTHTVNGCKISFLSLNYQYWTLLDSIKGFRNRKLWQVRDKNIYPGPPMQFYLLRSWLQYSISAYWPKVRWKRGQTRQQ